MTRRKAKRLVKRACIFVGIGIAFLSPFFLVPDLTRSQFGNKDTLASHTTRRESRKFKMVTKQTPLRKEYSANSVKENEATETLAPENVFPPQLSRDERCGNNILEEKLQFHEAVHGSVVYSAFLDYRFKEQTFIRMISILPSYGEPTQMYCHFMDSRTQQYFTSVVEIEELGMNEGFGYQGFLSSCDLPEEIDGYILCSVNISVEPEAYRQTNKNTKEISLNVLDHGGNTQTYGLCVPPITGEISVARLVEFIELSQLLGVSHFTFYTAKVTDKILEVLRYYREKGVLSIHPWELPYYIASNVQESAQTAALNDCLYRNMGKFDYVAFNKLDEFIIPKQDKRTLQIFESVKYVDAAGYCFQSFTFDTSKSVAKNSQLYTQRFTSRTKQPTDQLSRCVVSPKKVFSLDLNSISNPSQTFYSARHVEPSFGHVFHYGECNNGEWDCTDSRLDLTMVKYRDELEMRFNVTMSHLQQASLGNIE